MQARCELAGAARSMRADGERVEDHVFASPALSEHWAYLDAFEGDGYVRQKVTVLVNGTEAVDAYEYAFPPDTELAGI